MSPKFFIKSVLSTAVVLLAGCLKPDMPAEPGCGVSLLSVKAGNSPESRAWTKAGISSPYFEEAIVCAALGIYDAHGQLVHSERASGSFDGFDTPVRLHSDQSYTCYLVTGYIAGAMDYPANESDLLSLTIENPTYDDVAEDYSLVGTMEEFGLDRAGKTDCLTPRGLDLLDGSADGVIRIPLRSLWAKVRVNLDFSEVEGVSLDEDAAPAQLCGPFYGNRVFAPFCPGGSRTVTDRLALLPRAGRTATDGDGIISFVFYTPENMLGNLLPDNRDMDLKTPSSVSAIHGETLGMLVDKSAVVLDSQVSTPWGQSTSLTFRFCLGDNPTGNFDIAGNSFYDVTLTATANGYKIKEWKGEYVAVDNRSLELQTFSVHTEKRNSFPKTVTIFDFDDFTQCSNSSPCYLLANYYVGEERKSWEGYGAANGWRLTSETQALLNELGISCAAVHKYVFAINGQTSIYYSDQPSSVTNPAASVSHLEGPSVQSTLLRFFIPVYVPGGLSVPISIETFDGEHRASVTIQTPASGSLGVDWEHQPKYIGQQGRLIAGSMNGTVCQADFSVKEGSEDIMEVIDNHDNSCTVRLLGAGSGYVHYRGLDMEGICICEGDMPVSILAPTLLAGSDTYSLSPDGTAVTVGYRYTDASGQLMTRAAQAGGGYGNYFEPDLFDALLLPLLSAGDSPVRPLLGLDGMSVYVARLSSGNISAESYLDAAVPGALVLRAGGAQDIAPAQAAVRISSPPGNYGAGRLLCSIDNHILTGAAALRTEGSIAVRAGSTARFPADAFSIQGNYSAISVEPLPDMTFSITPDGGLSVSGKAEPEGYSAGKIPVYFTVRNSRSGESIRLEAGYINAYLHIRCGAVIDLDKPNPEVSAEMKAYQAVPAFTALRNALRESSPCVICTFGRGGYYNLGYGHWNHIDEFDDAGNQYVAPEQNYLMTEFVESNWQGPVKLGETAYRIIPGVLERNAGVYDSPAAFYADNPSPPIDFIFSGANILTVSPFNSGMYHYNATPALADDEGYSFYIIDRESAGWI